MMQRDQGPLLLSGFSHYARLFGMDRLTIMDNGIPAGGVDLIDNGQHMPNSALEPGFAATRLTYQHWHNRSFDEMRERARQKIGTSLIDPTDDFDLRRYAMLSQAPGRHPLPVVVCDAQRYRARYDDSLWLFLPEGAAPGGAALPGETGLPVIEDRRGCRAWSDTAYLAANGDVANHPLGPLHHFLRYGWAEERLERPSA